MNGTDALISLIRTLEKAEVPYMIVGSYSSNFYGIPRSTKDADLVVSLDLADWEKLASLLPTDLALEQQSSFEMVTSTRLMFCENHLLRLHAPTVQPLASPVHRAG